MNNIKRLREQNNLSLRDLAGKTNISFVTLSRLENDLQKLYDHHLIALADYFKVSIDYVLGREWNDPEKTIIKTREFDYNDMLKKLESLSDKQLYNLSGAIDYILEMRDDKETFTKKETSSNTTLKY
jgi:transcriptional regulator with XRE-family HTH domain